MTDKHLSGLLIITGLLKGVANECKDVKAAKVIMELANQQEVLLTDIMYSEKDKK